MQGTGPSSQTQTGDNPDTTAAPARPPSTQALSPTSGPVSAQPAGTQQAAAASSASQAAGAPPRHGHTFSADEDAELFSQALALSLSIDSATLAQASEASPAAGPPSLGDTAPVHNMPGHEGPGANAWQMVHRPSVPVADWDSSALPSTTLQHSMPEPGQQAAAPTAGSPGPGPVGQAQQQSPQPSTPSDASALTQAPAEAMLETPASTASAPLAAAATADPPEPAQAPQHPAQTMQEAQQADQEVLALMRESFGVPAAAGADSSLPPEAAALSSIATGRPGMAADGQVGPLSPHTLLGMAEEPGPSTFSSASQHSAAASLGSILPEQCPAPSTPQGDAAAPTAPAGSAAAAAAADSREDASAKRAKELAVAEVLHQFLECSQGQLTAHGLVSLQEVCTLACPCKLPAFLQLV